ncbi:MAG TPA: glycosyltransferase family 39 protein [Thermoanaerobaculia bacterium]|nr:glycosyltransferase family 39 protein [Thermoanaerobaculia bacterium]
MPGPEESAASGVRPAAAPPGPALIAGLVLALLLCFAGLGRSLWSPDEPTGAAVGRAMLATGDLVVPRLNGQPFLEKPPLYWWVQVLSFRAFGVSPAAARLPSALFGALTLGVTWALGRRFGPRPGLLAPLVLASTALFVEETGRVVVDPALALFVALAHLGFVQLAEPGSSVDRGQGWRDWRQWRAAALLALALPLAFLAKGVVALGLGAAPPVLYLLATRRQRALRDLLPLAALGLPLFALIIGPWALALYHRAGWPGVQECLLNNTAGRFLDNTAGRVYGHRQPLTYYLTVAPAVLLPWTLAVPAMLKAGILRSTGPGSDSRRLLFTTVVLGVLLLSAAASKRELYLLPLLPAFAACTAWWLDGVASRATGERSWDRPTLLTLLGLAALLPVVVWGLALLVRVAPPRAAALAPLRQALAPEVLAVWGAVALFLAALASARLVRSLSSGANPGPLFLLAAFLLLFLGLQSAVKSALDPVKSLDELAAAAARLAPGPGPVPAYLPPRRSAESLYGILGFQLNRTAEPLPTAADLRAYFISHPGARVVFRMEEVGTLPADLRRHLRFLYDETGGKASPYGIAEWGS